MEVLVGFALLLIAIATAERLGKSHRPIVFALYCFAFTNIAALLNLPPVLVYASTVAPPVVIVIAAWGALHSSWRPHLPILFCSGLAVATALALAADRFANFGHVMGYLWLSCTALGAAALVRGEAPGVTRGVIITLIFALPGEAVGWIGWRDGVDGPYFFARTITVLTFVVVIAIQRREIAPSPLWAGLQNRLGLKRSSRIDAAEASTKVERRP